MNEMDKMFGNIEENKNEKVLKVQKWKKKKNALEKEIENGRKEIEMEEAEEALESPDLGIAWKYLATEISEQLGDSEELPNLAQLEELEKKLEEVKAYKIQFQQNQQHKWKKQVTQLKELLYPFLQEEGDQQKVEELFLEWEKKYEKDLKFDFDREISKMEILFENVKSQISIYLNSLTQIYELNQNLQKVFSGMSKVSPDKIANATIKLDELIGQIKQEQEETKRVKQVIWESVQLSLRFGRRRKSFPKK